MGLGTVGAGWAARGRSTQKQSCMDVICTCIKPYLPVQHFFVPSVDEEITAEEPVLCVQAFANKGKQFPLSVFQQLCPNLLYIVSLSSISTPQDEDPDVHGVGDGHGAT